MEMTKQKRNRKVSFFFFIFIIGFLIGVFSVFLWKEELIEHETFMRIGTLEHIQIMEIDSVKLLISCLRSRLQFFIILILFSYTRLRVVVAGGYCGWLGFLAGMLLEVLSLRYGLKGILLFIVGVTPQFFFYILAFLLFVKFRFQRTGDANPNRQYGKRTGNVLRQIMEILLIIMLVILGGVAEGYVNPWMIEQILKIF